MELVGKSRDVMKKENDELKQANYQSRAWHESQKTSMTKAAPEADNLQEHTCPFQDLLPRSLVTSRPITRARCQHSTTLPGEMEFLRKEPQDLAKRCQKKSGEHAWGWIKGVNLGGERESGAALGKRLLTWRHLLGLWICPPGKGTWSWDSSLKLTGGEKKDQGPIRRQKPQH